MAEILLQRVQAKGIQTERVTEGFMSDENLCGSSMAQSVCRFAPCNSLTEDGYLGCSANNYMYAKCEYADHFGVTNRMVIRSGGWVLPKEAALKRLSDKSDNAG